MSMQHLATDLATICFATPALTAAVSQLIDFSTAACPIAQKMSHFVSIK
jgi:hypothetical protein